MASAAEVPRSHLSRYFPDLVCFVPLPSLSLHPLHTDRQCIRFQARENPFRIPRRSSLRARVAHHHPGTRLSPPTPPLFLDLFGAALTYVTASLGLLMAAVEFIQLSIACRLPHAPAPSPRHPSSYGPAHWPPSMSMLQHSLWLSLP